jgi:hypothetical protein
MALVVAEFDKRGHFVKRLDDCADLAADEPMLGRVAEKRDRAQEVASWVAWFNRSRHRRTQQVTKRGICSPLLKIQIGLQAGI